MTWCSTRRGWSLRDGDGPGNPIRGLMLRGRSEAIRPSRAGADNGGPGRLTVKVIQRERLADPNRHVAGPSGCCQAGRNALGSPRSLIGMIGARERKSNEANALFAR